MYSAHRKKPSRPQRALDGFDVLRSRRINDGTQLGALFKTGRTPPGLPHFLLHFYEQALQPILSDLYSARDQCKGQHHQTHTPGPEEGVSDVFAQFYTCQCKGEVDARHHRADCKTGVFANQHGPCD